jgi:hypothetical protein
MHNHLDVLKWLRLNRCDWNDKVCQSAIQYGNLDVLKWAVENGCPCNDKTWSNALIRWKMYTDGSEGTYKLCMSNKHIDILKYWYGKVSEGVIVL